MLQEFDLPDPETVDDEEGLSRFFDGKVPDRLRQIALRRLWRINPLFAVVDDMVEYGEDYTDAATVVDGLQSAYQAGKGYMEKLAREAEAAKEAEEADALTGDDDSTGADADDSTDAAADPEENSEEMANPENQEKQGKILTAYHRKTAKISPLTDPWMWRKMLLLQMMTATLPSLPLSVKLLKINQKLSRVVRHSSARDDIGRLLIRKKIAVMGRRQVISRIILIKLAKSPYC